MAAAVVFQALARLTEADLIQPSTADPSPPLRTLPAESLSERDQILFQYAEGMGIVDVSFFDGAVNVSHRPVRDANDPNFQVRRRVAASTISMSLLAYIA